MTLELPAAVEPFGDDWSKSGVYVIRYSVPENVHERADRVFDHPPEWLDALAECSACLYVGEATNVMHRIEDHNNGNVRKTTLARLGGEPIGIVNILYHDSKEDAQHAEYNTAKRVARQTDEKTMVIVNGQPV